MIKKEDHIKKIDSFELTEYVLFKIGKASHLKIQKLLYYIQGFHLAYFDKPIIEDDFQAWLHGPVSRKLYDRVKGKSILHKELSYTEEEGEEKIEERIKKLSPEQIELITEVLDAYGDLSGIELESLTHNEEPWIEARKGYSNGDRCEVVIEKSSMESFFKKELYEDKKT